MHRREVPEGQVWLPQRMGEQVEGLELVWKLGSGNRSNYVEVAVLVAAAEDLKVVRVVTLEVERGKGILVEVLRVGEDQETLVEVEKVAMDQEVLVEVQQVLLVEELRVGKTRLVSPAIPRQVPRQLALSVWEGALCKSDVSATLDVTALPV